MSICMMIKNEEINLRRCLESLKPLMKKVSSELIIVDTGSTDNSVKIAEEYTDKLFFHPWNNDFSAMRNTTIGYATGEWVLIIDADEELENYKGIVEFVKAKHGKSVGGALMTVLNITGRRNERLPLMSARVFRRAADFCYTGVIHNQPHVKGQLLPTEASLLHYGYITTDSELMKKKFQRTSLLLRKELEKDPNDYYYRYQLAVTHSMYGDNKQALHEIIKAYHLIYRDEALMKQNIYILGAMVQFHIAAGFSDEEMVTIALKALEMKPEYVDVSFFIAQIYALREEFEKSYQYYDRYLQLVENFAQLKIRNDISISHYTLNNSIEAHFNMAIMSIKVGELERAKKHAAILMKSKIENKEFRGSVNKMIVQLDYAQGSFAENHQFYHSVIKAGDELTAAIVEDAEARWQKASPEVRDAYSRVFAELPDLYGTLNRVRLGKIPVTELAQEIFRKDANQMQPYFSLTLFALMQDDLLCESGGELLTEQTILSYMKHLDESHRQEFLSRSRQFVFSIELTGVVTYSKARLAKNIAKYLLFSGELDEEEYKQVFAVYLNAGKTFLQTLYNEFVFTKELVFDLKNVEEIFLLYMMLSERSKSDGSMNVQYLRKALAIYPDMSKGVEIILQTMSVKEGDSEMEQLTKQLLANVESLIAAGQYEEALNMINECETIIGGDVRLLAYKTAIIKKRHETTS